MVLGIDSAAVTAKGTVALALVTWRYIVLANRLAKAAHLAAETERVLHKICW